MCDYSLEFYRSRPAQIGEKYTLTRFQGGSNGFASPGDCSTAICVQSDTRLELSNIPIELQRAHGLDATEIVTMVYQENGPYRDGIEFDNGVQLSLQDLEPGVIATISSSLSDALQHRDLAEVF